MASLLPTEIANIVANAFRGQLMTGQLRREVSVGVDDLGDPLPASSVTYSVQGIRDNFNAHFMSMQGIPHTDVRILLIVNLTSPPTMPKQDDEIFIRNEWHRVRRVVEIDPASASITLQCFRITAPGSN